MVRRVVREPTAMNRIGAVAILLLLGSAISGCASKLPPLGPEALASLRRDAEAGITPAQIELGDRYRDGASVEKNALASLTWYRAAATSGSTDALKRFFCDRAIDWRNLPTLETLFPQGMADADDEEDTVGPALRREVKPAYTPSAMRSKAQGSVAMEIVILENGFVGGVVVTRPFDPPGVDGLEDQALCAASQWQFEPATRNGSPVVARTKLILDFRLH